MYIIGIGDVTHDPSVCLIKNGAVIAAIEYERLSRIKHNFYADPDKYNLTEQGDDWSNRCNELTIAKREAMFNECIEYCLKIAGITKDKIDIYAVSTLFDTAPVHTNKAIYIPHHLAHCANAFYSSPFKESAILSVDGYSNLYEEKSQSIFFAQGIYNHVTTIGSVEGEHVIPSRLGTLPNSHITFNDSLGVFYQNISMLLGMGYFSEGKTMGLSAYGKRNSDFDFINDFIDVTRDGKVNINNTEIFLKCQDILTSARKIMDDRSFFQMKADLAFKHQLLLEKSIFKLCHYLYDKTGLENLCISGGVALNSVMNAKIIDNTPFKKVFIPPAAGDGGISIGTALLVDNKIRQSKRFYIENRFSPYLGMDYSDIDINSAINPKSKHVKIINEGEAAINEVAELISQGKIIGWFNGRSEIGPRALGNRSILADPRNPNIRDILNKKVKHREIFRPFAPAVLEEKADEYFHGLNDSAYMLFVNNVKEDKKNLIPSVTHVDGTARLQSVSRELNPTFYQLIQAFEAITNIPMVINTSFNVAGQPIVETPSDAIECFLSTKIDALFLNGKLLTKELKLTSVNERQPDTSSEEWAILSE